MNTKLITALAACLMFTPLIGKDDKVATIKLSRSQEIELRKGTIRKYLWYAAGLIIPQLLVRLPPFALITTEGANTFTVGTALRIAGDLGSFESLQWLGEQAVWGATAHEILHKNWVIKPAMDATLRGAHQFLGAFTGNNPANVSSLNDAIEIVLLGNMLKTLYEYW